MENLKQSEPEPVSAWIDCENSIVSFTEQPGFVQIAFSTHTQMFAYVVACAQNDYLIL